MNSRRLTSLLATLALIAAGIAAASAQDPAPLHFVVTIDGLNAGQFTSVEGLCMELEVIEFREGADLLVRKRPGRAKYGNITLKRGYISNTAIQDWWHQLANGNFLSRTISISLQDSAGTSLQTWNLHGCWPKSWKLGILDHASSGVAIEVVELVVEEVVPAP